MHRTRARIVRYIYINADEGSDRTRIYICRCNPAVLNADRTPRFLEYIYACLSGHLHMQSRGVCYGSHPYTSFLAVFCLFYMQSKPWIYIYMCVCAYVEPAVFIYIYSRVIQSDHILDLDSARVLVACLSLRNHAYCIILPLS